MQCISPLSLEQRRQAALRWSRSQYAQNSSQIRTRNAQHNALTSTSNLEVAEEARSRNSAARSQRRRSKRIRVSERLRNTDNRATWGAIEENRGLEPTRDAEAHARARSNSEERRRQQVQNTAAESKWNELLVILSLLLDRRDITEEEAAALSSAEKTRFIPSDPVTCSRYFDYRFRQLMKLIKSSEIFGVLRLVHYCWRIEFQHRGSPHFLGMVGFLVPQS